MFLLLLLPLIGGVLFFVGKAILKQLGNPFAVENATKWGLLFLSGVVLYQAAPQTIQALAATPIPSSDILALAVPLGYAVIAFYGYLNLKRDILEPQREERERLPPRHRAAPPPPAAEASQAPANHARGGGNAFRTVDEPHEGD